MIPWFLQHYLPIVDKIFVHDNYSTDNSIELLSGDERISVEEFDVAGDSLIAGLRRKVETMWHRSRGEADWVFIVEMDEHLYHRDMRRFLTDCNAAGLTAVRVAGYQMVADDFPPVREPLTSTVVRGFGDEDFDKFCIFSPDAITATNFNEGRHRASPLGYVRWTQKTEVKLLHYKALGLDYLTHRSWQLRDRLRPGDKSRGWGNHYRLTRDGLAKMFLRYSTLARPVINVGECRDGLGVELEIKEMRVPPALREGNTLCFVLPACCSEFWVVQQSDSKPMPGLGVEIGRMSLVDLRGTTIPLTSTNCREGWWGTSYHDGQLTRWTSERARVTLDRKLQQETLLLISMVPE